MTSDGHYGPMGGRNDTSNHPRPGGGPGGRSGKSGGAAHLARIHGTEEDKVNCPFYFKIGACRHADRCSRLHHRPAFSQCILIKHIYRHPIREDAQHCITPEEKKAADDAALEDFFCFFEDLYIELGKFGRLEALHVCDNLGDHMIGHVYAKFSDEEEAADALNVMNGRYYDGRKMEVEFSPVSDFREARCRDFDEDTCSRGGFCNFMHIKPLPFCLIASLQEESEAERRRDFRDREHRMMKERERARRRKERRKGGSRRGDDRSISSSDDDSDDHRSSSRRKRSRSRSRSRSR